MNESAPLKQLPSENCDITSVDISWANSLADRMHRELNLGDYPASLLAQRLEEDYGVLLMMSPWKMVLQLAAELNGGLQLFSMEKKFLGGICLI